MALELVQRLRSLAPRYDARSRQYVHCANGAPLVGLVKTLESAFYVPSTHVIRKYRGTSSSIHTGVEMDAEMDEWVSNGVFPHSKYGRSVVGVLQRNNIRVLGTQVPITDPELGVYAVADGIGVDSSGHVVVLEWKTGYDVAYTTARGRMESPLGDVPNSYRNRHALQVYVASLLLRKHGVPDARCLVVVANKLGTRTWHVDKKLCAADTGILKCLSERVGH